MVEELVIAEWPTLRNTHVNRPRELLRSLIIDALATSISKNPKVAGVVWNTAVSPLSHGQTRLGRAKSLIEKLMLQARDAAEAEAILIAGMAPTFSPKRSRKKASTETAPLAVAGRISDKDILQDIGKAAGPQYPAGQPIENANPHWSNQAQHWSLEFAPRMTSAVVKAVNLGITKLAESINGSLASYVGGLQNQFSEQLREVEQVQSEIARGHDMSRMRLDVLWWSEALYSPQLQLGYRELELPVAAVAAAVDLVAIVPPLAPASVRYVLGETVCRIARIANDDTKRPLSVFLERLSTAKTNFGETFSSSATNDARQPLLGLAGEENAGHRSSPDIIRSRTGVDIALELTAADFAMWIYSDLQAKRLVEDIS
jgi:hypothetical protein